MNRAKTPHSSVPDVSEEEQRAGGWSMRSVVGSEVYTVRGLVGPSRKDCEFTD